jgi:hypothetical protein
LVDKLIITKEGIQTIHFTHEELTQREADRLAQEEQAMLDALIPSREEVAQAEFELKTITLLMEVGLL